MALRNPRRMSIGSDRSVCISALSAVFGEADDDTTRHIEKAAAIFVRTVVETISGSDSGEMFI
jgi:hypothetical protein